MSEVQMQMSSIIIFAVGMTIMLGLSIFGIVLCVDFIIRQTLFYRRWHKAAFDPEIRRRMREIFKDNSTDKREGGGE